MTLDRTDKTKWPAGPWQSEPDRVEWQHDGFACLIVRQPELGHLCGYVAVPPGHPWHGLNDSSVYDLPEDKQPSAHGGVTYAERCQGTICHVPAPGEPDDVWWLGFDAAHSGDYSPGIAAICGSRQPNSYETYRDIGYMRVECERLARQAKAVK